MHGTMDGTGNVLFLLSGDLVVVAKEKSRGPYIDVCLEQYCGRDWSL